MWPDPVFAASHPVNLKLKKNVTFLPPSFKKKKKSFRKTLKLKSRTQDPVIVFKKLMSACKHCDKLVLFGAMDITKLDIGGMWVHGITQQRQEYNILLLSSEIKHPYTSNEPGNTAYFSQAYESQGHLISNDKGKWRDKGKTKWNS